MQGVRECAYWGGACNWRPKLQTQWLRFPINQAGSARNGPQTLCTQAGSGTTTTTAADYKAWWADWKKEYKKSYATPAEEEHAFKNFCNNMDLVRSINYDDNKTYWASGNRCVLRSQALCLDATPASAPPPQIAL